MHSSYMFARRRKEEIVRDNMGHANIDVTQNVYWRVACPSKLLACGTTREGAASLRPCLVPRHPLHFVPRHPLQVLGVRVTRGTSAREIKSRATQY
jgi:hypothetical protein